ncbi:hypothetical protein FE392_13640 [Xenorhabdus sp. 12]|uniref:Uncharacterized protein n=1 Tax=Xenorhabdus santafensis TaxID=2582833 RepID=A0ABU4SC52_9GAMM|nr:hypothetical protein [Xenorhabdus sp. 12]MDX7988360.1 hypothetical protein [Xenorhabdus sp. 12]
MSIVQGTIAVILEFKARLSIVFFCSYIGGMAVPLYQGAVYFIIPHILLVFIIGVWQAVLVETSTEAGDE